MTQLALTNEKINSYGGLTLSGRLLSKFCRIENYFKDPKGSRSDRISNADILTSMIGLLVQGRTHYEDIELFRQDESQGFSEALDLEKIPSESTLRIRLEAMASRASMQKLEGINLALLKAHAPSPLEINGRKYIANDIDVTPMDNTGSHRENVGRTYKGCDGFAPIMSNLGQEGFLLHHELRPGIQHCQKNTPGFLIRNFELLKKLNLQHPVLARLDSGNDSGDTIEVLRNSGHFFLVKRNLRREDRVKWLSHAMSQGDPERPRKGKEIYTGSIEHLIPGGKKSTQDPLTCVYRVSRRSIDKFGQGLLIDEIEVETYWTNLGESPEDVIKLYHDHGTSEQFHSEIKSDMGIERFPSNNYGVNQLFLALGAIAYNILRSIDSRAMKLRELWPQHLRNRSVRLQRRRVGSVMRDLISVACKVVSHAGRKTIKIARCWPWSKVLISIDRQLA